MRNVFTVQLCFSVSLLYAPNILEQVRCRPELLCKLSRKQSSVLVLFSQHIAASSTKSELSRHSQSLPYLRSTSSLDEMNPVFFMTLFISQGQL